MKKEELENRLASIEKELEKLLTILNKDPEEYAEEINKECGNKYKLDWVDTYPYKVGVAQSVIKWILTEDF